MEKSLIEKKEKLFKIGDLAKWSSGPFSAFKDEKQMVEMKEKLMKDKNLAYTYMLPKETQEYEQKKEELGFLTNHCFSEVQRVANDNGKIFRLHFRDMSHSMCSFINTVSYISS